MTVFRKWTNQAFELVPVSTADVDRQLIALIKAADLQNILENN